MNTIKKIIFFCIIFLSFIPFTSAKEITINLFYSQTCPHCSEEKKFLEQYQKENKNIVVKMYEVTQDEYNSNLLKMVKETLKCENNYVPYTVIGNVGLTGYSDNIKSQIIHFTQKYQKEDYEDIVSKVIENNAAIKIEEEQEKQQENKKMTLPIIGEVNVKEVSLPLIAIIIGFVDGFNPCAMWVLIFLISMLIGSKNKKRMIALGIIFLITSSLIYLLFMGTWLKVMLSTMQINIIKIIIGIIAIIGAIWNLRSFYNSIKKDVGCEVVNNDKRKKLVKKIKKFTTEKSFIIAALGMISLAISINFIEFACSAGWPVVFTEILALNELSDINYFIYLLIYILFYMIDDIVIFIIAIITLKVTGISNKYNKYSHLIGGIMMLIIGLLMIFKPEWLMMNF